jgi:hypothetical protein
MHELRRRSNRPEWPTLLCRTLEAEFARQRELPIRYNGAAVFIDREDVRPGSAQPGTEKRAVRNLFRSSRSDPSGCLWVDSTPYWLLSYEVPCFARATKQCADLVGLSTAGGLVVFECKLANDDAPITAALEGLDYLTCLSSRDNFSRLRAGVAEWVARMSGVPGWAEPPTHAGVRPDREARPEVIVLGSEGYYEPYLRRERDRGWAEFARACRESAGRPGIGFARTDFASARASLGPA